MECIPIVIVSGFLGSGKTTLLIRILAEMKKRGLQPGVLMNELGRRDVDGVTLHSEFPGLSMEKLFDGCICCDRKGEVSGSLSRLIELGPDVIIMELTGVANPEEIAECLTDPQIMTRVRLELIITVLDAEHVLEYNSIFSSDRQLVRTLRRQIELADLILVNKTDLIGEAQQNKVAQAVRKINGKSNLIFTRYSSMELSAFMDGWKPLHQEKATPRVRFRLASGQRQEDHSSSVGADSCSYSRLLTLELPCAGDKPIRPGSVEKFISLWKGAVIRAKGYVRLEGKKEGMAFQYAGGRISWTQTAYDGSPYLILIGLELDGEAVLKRWREWT